MVHFYPLNELISMPATGLKKVGTGATKGWKSKKVNWRQVCNMISYKRDVSERQSLSEIKMGRGSLIVEGFANLIIYSA